MKAPANFDRQWHNMVKDEAHRVAREIINQVALDRSNYRFIKVEVDPLISKNMNSFDIDRFLSYFDCPGLYMTAASGKPTFTVAVRADLVNFGIEAPIHKVKPIRVNKSHKI